MALDGVEYHRCPDFVDIGRAQSTVLKHERGAGRSGRLQIPGGVTIWTARDALIGHASVLGEC